jgi:hypothetical protein
MDAALKAKWVEALRDGKYEQGQSYLRRGTQFCCLGVLCDLVSKNEWEVTDSNIFRFRGVRGFLPGELRDGAGISVGEENDVANMNDNGKSFAEIADYIEANL